jgi:hypothetical protein
MLGAPVLLAMVMPTSLKVDMLTLGLKGRVTSTCWAGAVAFTSLLKPST